MTREEAIDVLKHNYPSTCFTDLCEAVDIAIQALSAQQEIVYCKDCKFSDEFAGDVWLCRRCKKAFRVLAVDTCKAAKRRANAMGRNGAE